MAKIGVIVIEIPVQKLYPLDIRAENVNERKEIVVAVPNGECAADQQQLVAVANGECAADQQQVVAVPNGEDAADQQQMVAVPNREGAADQQHVVAVSNGEGAADQQQVVDVPNGEGAADQQRVSDRVSDIKYEGYDKRYMKRRVAAVESELRRSLMEQWGRLFEFNPLKEV